MATLSSANAKYTAEQIAKTSGVSAETLATWGLTEATDILTISELAEMATSDAQAKTVLDKIVAQNAQTVVNGEVTASNIALASSEGGATLATGAFTTAIKANISAMWTWMTTTPLGWLTLLAAGVFVVVKAYDALTVSVEEQKEKMEESLSAYEDAKSELSSITTELENQEQKMSELLAKKKLTYAEKGQLEELQAITRELRVQKDLAEKEEGRTEKQLAQDASDLFIKQFGNYDISEDLINKYQKELQTDSITMNGSLTLDENNISAMIAGYKQFNKLLDDAYGSDSQYEIDHFKSLTEDLKDSIFTTAQELQTQQDNISAYYNSIKNTPYESLTTEQREIIDSYNEISNAIALIYQQLDPNSWNSMQVDDIFSTEGIEKTKDELVEMAKAGELTPNVINGYKNLNVALGETTLSAQDLCNELYAIAEAEKESQTSVSTKDDYLSLDSARESVTSLSEEYEVLQEILSDTANVSEETYSKLLSYSNKYSSALKLQNGRIVVNGNRLKQVYKIRQRDTKETMKQTLQLKKQEWLQWANNMGKYNDTLLESIQEKYNDIDVLGQEINQYQILMEAINGCSDALDNFKNAQETNDLDMYESAQEAFDVLDEVLTGGDNGDSELYGQYNRDEVKAAAEYLFSQEQWAKVLGAKTVDEYESAMQEGFKNLEPFFDESDPLNYTSLIDRVEGLDDGFKNSKHSIEEWADALQISPDAFKSLEQLANIYDYNDNQVFDNYFTDNLDEMYYRTNALADAQYALSQETDKTSNSYLTQKKAFDDASNAYNETINSMSQDTTEMYKQYQAMVYGTNTNETFDEYLGRHDYSETDIQGSEFAIIEKMKQIEEFSNGIKDDVSKKAYLESSGFYELDQTLQGLGVTYREVAENKQSLELTGTSEKTQTEIDNYKALKEEFDTATELMNNALASGDKSSFTQAKQDAESLAESLNTLREPLRIQIESNISTIDSEISSVKSKIEELKNTNVGSFASAGQMYNYQYRLGALENQQSSLESQKSSLASMAQDLEVAVKVNYEKGDTSDIDDVETNANTTLLLSDRSAIDNLSTTVATSLNVDKSPLNGLKADAAITLKVTNPGAISAATGGGGAYGTVNIGKSFADGSIGTEKELKNVMVSELKPEMVVDPHSGQYTIYNSPTMLDKLPKDAIVFNGDQTEQILKNGHASGFGKAYANGNVEGFAFDSGVGAKYNSGRALDIKNNNDAIKKAQDDIKETVEDTADDIEEASKEVFDWIERRISKLQRLTDKWIKNAETALTSGFITKYFNKAAKTLNKELKVQEQAFHRYQAEADKSGLSDDWKKKVNDGLVDIETITDETLAEQINDYQNWHNRSIAALEAFATAAEKRFNIPLEKAKAKIENFNETLDLLGKKLDNARFNTKKQLDNANALVKQQTDEEEKILNAYKNAQKNSKSNLKKQSKAMKSSAVLKGDDVSKSDKKKIKSAVKKGEEIDLSLFKEGSKAYQQAVKYNEALKANKQATYDAAVAQEEYNAWLVEASKIQFDNISKYYENQIKMLEYQMTDVDNKLSEIEKAGSKVNRSYYDLQKQINTNSLKYYQEERDILEENLKNIKKGTEEWYDAYDAIKQIDNEISKCITTTYELNEAIRQLYFDAHEGVRKDIDTIIDEQEFLTSLFSHEKTASSEFGNLTEAGTARLGSAVAKMNLSEERAKEDEKLLKKLQGIYAKYQSGDKNALLGSELPFDSIEQLEDAIENLYQTWQDDIKTTYDMQAEVVDIMKEKYQAELDMYQELVDKRKEALQAEKDLHDYSRQIEEKTSNIENLQMRLSAYSGDTSQEGMAKRQQLSAQLADAQDDLKETEYDKYLADQQDMLDNLITEYQELIQKKMDDFYELVDDGMRLSNENLGNIKGYLEQVAGVNGYTQEQKNLFDVPAQNIVNAIRERNSVSQTSVEDAKNTSQKPVDTSNSGNNNNTQPKEAVSYETSLQQVAHNRVQVDKVQTQLESVNAQLKQKNLSKKQKEKLTMQQKDLMNKLNVQQQILNQSQIKLVEDYINVKGSIAKKAKSEYSDVNKKFYSMFGKKILSTTELKELASLLGISYNNAKKKGNLYKELQNIGLFSSGGIAKLVKSKGEDGFVLARNGEGFVPPENVPAIQALANIAPQLNDVLQPLAKLPNLPKSSMKQDLNNIVCIDNVTLPNVTNYDEFKTQMMRDMQKDKKFESMVQDMTINRLSGNNRLGKYRQNM